MDQIIDLIKVVGICATVCSGICAVGLFVIRSLIHQNNDKLLDRFNSRYIKRELYEERDRALNQKLDLIHSYQKERIQFEMDRFDEVSDMCQSVQTELDTHNVRLAVIENNIGRAPR